MRFVQCSRNSPCPICGKTHWCSVSDDGKVSHCRRSGFGGEEVTDKGGVSYYVHQLSGDARKVPVSLPAVKNAKRADELVLHGVYSALLAAMPLWGSHRTQLLNRGVPDVDINRREYGSMTEFHRFGIATKLRERFGDVVLEVPGFVSRDGRDGPYLTISGWPGLMVPCRNHAGHIVAIKIRRDDPNADSKYTSLSSKSSGGPGPGAVVHVPYLSPLQSDVVRVTEGELKADVALIHTGVTTISLPGVGMWKSAIPVLEQFGCRTVRLAFDSDARENRDVAAALADLAEFLDCENFHVEVEMWDPAYKGIDDAVKSGAVICVATGNEAIDVIDGIVSSSGLDRRSNE